MGRVGDLPPVAVDPVHLGAVDVVAPGAGRGGGRPRVVAVAGGLSRSSASLYEAVRHVDAEPGDPPVEPEPQDRVELRGARPRSTSSGPAAPAGSCAGSTGRSAHRAPTPARRRPRASCWAASRRAAGRATRSSRRCSASRPRPGVDEPRVVVAGVVRHQVEQHPDASRRRLRDQRVEGRQVAELRMDVAVVGDVVAPVADPATGSIGESQMPSTPSHSRWSRWSITPRRSPMPSPSASAKERT